MNTPRNQANKGDPPVVSISAWKSDKDEKSVTYMFQIQTRSARALKKIAKSLAGEETGSGYNPNSKESILLIKKVFSSCEEFNAFIDNFELKITKVK